MRTRSNRPRAHVSQTRVRTRRAHRIQTSLPKGNDKRPGMEHAQSHGQGRRDVADCAGIVHAPFDAHDMPGGRT